jgi:GAF domain-containing protein
LTGYDAFPDCIGRAMKRRSKVTGKPVKPRRHKASKPKRELAPNVASRPATSAVGKDEQIARLTYERDEALEQQAATTDILQLISSSPENLHAVFATILENAVRICDASFGDIGQLEDGVIRLLAIHKATPAAFIELRRQTQRVPPVSNSPSARILATKVPLHIHDLKCDRAYLERSAPMTVAAVELGGLRTFLGVPLLKEHEVVGIMFLGRQFVRPFTDKQIELVKNFAAQAVIAIENARLLNELRQRTTDLSEALEQQTATSEVLQVVSGSPGDLEPVFATMLEKAVRICGASFGNVQRWDGETLQLAASHNTPRAFAQARRSARYRPDPELYLSRVLTTKTVVHITDAASDKGYLEKRNPYFVAAVELGGVRTALLVPMLKEHEPIGVFSLYRQEIRPFTDKQIALVTNFAAQAVIAIENARLLNELRQSLEQQTATAQVLQVISRSTGELSQVFSTILANATRICEAKFGTLYLKEGDGFRATATHNAPPAYDEARAQLVYPSPHAATWQAANTKEPIQITDVISERGYSEFVVSAVKLGGYRSVLSVPLVHEDEVVGVISIFRQEVSSFSDEHISLLQNFAAQAVIAIENARLLSDLQARTQQLSALNEHLEHRVADQVGEIERMSRLRRFLPPQVADLIVASGSEKQLESHRREITALFCDLRGFTGFTESADAEDVMALLRDYHAAIGEIIIKYNGTLERYAGDGVMVVFNDPVPVENPALQAVLMALEVRDALGALTETWRRLGHEIGFGIGIAHGFATLGTIGFEGRFDYAAIGTVSNVASRLCDEAKPGQILISPRVLTKVENAVRVEPVGEFELKGIRRPLAAYNVLAVL